ncbi:MAG TPA: YdcF family protein [Vicinamibacterales bacterium]|nr:YdcF family protein [Vicinamibacterales bacterium]
MSRFRLGLTPHVCRRIVIAELGLLVLILALAPFAGLLLYREDPLERADTIMVLAGARAERWLEAADLYREGVAPIVAVSPGRHEPAEDLAAARGLRLASDGEQMRAALIALGVPADAIVVLPGAADNTAEEAVLFHAAARAHGWRSVVVVTSRLHTRRTGLAFRRALAESGVRVLVRASRHDADDPRYWWRRRQSVRQVVEELPKLAAYAIGLGG